MSNNNFKIRPHLIRQGNTGASANDLPSHNAQQQFHTNQSKYVSNSTNKYAMGQFKVPGEAYSTNNSARSFQITERSNQPTMNMVASNTEDGIGFSPQGEIHDNGPGTQNNPTP